MTEIYARTMSNLVTSKHATGRNYKGNSGAGFSLPNGNADTGNGQTPSHMSENRRPTITPPPTAVMSGDDARSVTGSYGSARREPVQAPGRGLNILV